jgi:hypothetical protein
MKVSVRNSSGEKGKFKAAKEKRKLSVPERTREDDDGSASAVESSGEGSSPEAGGRRAEVAAGASARACCGAMRVFGTGATGRGVGDMALVVGLGRICQVSTN